MCFECLNVPTNLLTSRNDVEVISVLIWVFYSRFMIHHKSAGIHKCIRQIKFSMKHLTVSKYCDICTAEIVLSLQSQINICPSSILQFCT